MLFLIRLINFISSIKAKREIRGMVGMNAFLDHRRKQFGQDMKFRIGDMRSAYVNYIKDSVDFIDNPEKFDFFWEDNNKPELYDQREYFEDKFGENRWVIYLICSIKTN